MFRFVALFALVAVAAAEPQYWPYAGVSDPAHLKTPSGDTVSVQAAKVQHAQLKAAEYAKKGYAPVYAAQQVVYKAPAAVYKAPIAAAAVPAVFSHGIQSAGVYSTGYGYPTAHHLFKREAEADSDSLMYTNAYTTPYINNAYNYAGVYRNPVATYASTGYTGYTSPVYSGVYSGYGYPTAHHLGKRDADSQVYQYSTGYPYANTYAGVNFANTYGLNNYVHKAPVTTATYGYATPYSTYGNIWNGLHY